jgi:flagellar biosynthesis/type III secretory pathway protein FliH
MNPNPGITSPRDGARNLRRRSPRDLTSRRYEELHREQAERQKIQADPVGYARQARQEGFNSGYDAGYEYG